LCRARDGKRAVLASEPDQIRLTTTKSEVQLGLQRAGGDGKRILSGLKVKGIEYEASCRMKVLNSDLFGKNLVFYK
jgi:hypothetical protein